MTAVGGRDRFRTRPWLVLLFGVVLLGLALTSLTLVLVQILLVHALCTLCLCSAAISFVTAWLGRDEVFASLRHVRRTRHAAHHAGSLCVAKRRPSQMAPTRHVGTRACMDSLELWWLGHPDSIPGSAQPWSGLDRAFLSPHPGPGAHGTRVAEFHPQLTVLVFGRRSRIPYVAEARRLLNPDMRFQRFDDRYIVRLESGEPLIETLTRILARRTGGVRATSARPGPSAGSAWGTGMPRPEITSTANSRNSCEVVSFEGNARSRTVRRFCTCTESSPGATSPPSPATSRTLRVHPTLEVWLRTENVPVRRVHDSATGLDLLDLPDRISSRPMRNGVCSMNTQPKPEVVVVTGAGAGLGRAIVQSFARRGAHIGLVSRSQERLEDARREVEQLGGKALVLPGDVADPATTENAAARRVEEAFGPIDIWVNDAMTTVFSPFHEMSADDFKRVTEVTYLGFVYGTMAALKRMRPRNHGTIVQVGSALAYRSIPLQSAYCGAKHAIVGFTDSIRSELIHDGSRVHITVVQMPASEYAAVLVVQEQHGARRRSRCRLSFSPRWAPRRCIGPRTSDIARFSSAGRRHAPSGANDSFPESWTIWPRTWHGTGSCMAERPIRIGQSTCTSRSLATRQRTAPSTARRRTAVGNSPSRCTPAGWPPRLPMLRASWSAHSRVAKRMPARQTIINQGMDSMANAPTSPYPRISDYGLVGDCHSAALIARDGSVDWFCPGRFDAPAVFCRLLDADKGGYLRTAPVGSFSVERRYRGPTNVLETTFSNGGGRVRMTDLMPVHQRTSDRQGYDVGTSHRFLRQLEASRERSRSSCASNPPSTTLARERSSMCALARVRSRTPTPDT